MVQTANAMLAKINVYPERDGKQHVEIYISLDSLAPVVDLHVGIALDASRSMVTLYGADVPAAFRQNKPIERVIRALSKYATGFTGDGTVALQYWALGPGGGQVESLGSFGAAECDALEVGGPAGNQWGTGTKLVPAVNEFMNNIPSGSNMALLLIITDGVIEDMAELKERSMEIGQEMVADPEKKLKFVIMALFHDAITDKERRLVEANLYEIEDMFEGTELGEQGIDLWDTKIASEMTHLAQIWDDVDYPTEITIPGSARVMDDKGEELKSFPAGFPQKLEFYVKAGTPYVTLELAGTTIKQPLG